MKSRNLILGSWLGVIALASIRQVTSGTPGLPSPAAYLGSGVLFTTFYVGGALTPSSNLFGILAVGVVISTLLKPYINSQGAIPASGPIFQVSQLLDQAAGVSKPATPNS